MEVENVMFFGWMALPLIAYAGGRAALLKTEHRRGGRPAPDAEQRLAQLRRLRDDGHVVPRGRMADAVRLAQDAGAATPLGVRQP